MILPNPGYQAVIERIFINSSRIYKVLDSIQSFVLTNSQNFSPSF